MQNVNNLPVWWLAAKFPDREKGTPVDTRNQLLERIVLEGAISNKGRLSNLHLLPVNLWCTCACVLKRKESIEYHLFFNMTKERQEWRGDGVDRAQERKIEAG